MRLRSRERENGEQAAGFREVLKMRKLNVKVPVTAGDSAGVWMTFYRLVFERDGKSYEIPNLPFSLI